ncbi:MAG: metal-dependent hydrolase [Theionarchaea archaeon]|nr:metal-dependent hydrolase [Theionarchaea archaeon]
MKITYLSHACFELKNTRTILIDPFFEGNAYAPSYTANPHIILVTHEHHDHSDAQRFESLVVCPETCADKYEKTVTMHIGEKRIIEGIPIEMVGASHHQSPYPTGYILQFEGNRIYHMGDTYIDGVRNYGNIDILFIPIGGYFTMNQEEALEALRIIKPRIAVPMHYNTFPQIRADPLEFKKIAEEDGFTVKVFSFGESREI